MKQAVVVGGSGGLGKALVTQLLDQGHEVIVVGRTNASDPRVKNFYRLETTEADWSSLYTAIEHDSGTAIDAVVFVSGTAVFGKTALIPRDRAQHMFELNFWTSTAAATAAAEHWIRSKHPGRFLAVLSIAARHSVPFEAYYCASKAAVERYLECLQLEYGGRNLHFIAAFPGMLRNSFRQHAEWYGMERNPNEGGSDVDATAEEIISLLKGNRTTRVIGWRERSIDLVDRFLPGTYGRLVLRHRVQKALLLRQT